ncbi:restriction endonuclease [uncultured Desulfovibrio sp.]|uniref:restriction endonuclease n=1 Tax=uncultured Desulfovibrio sp. TaxID=167968 RepID=UPI003439612D
MSSIQTLWVRRGRVSKAGQTTAKGRHSSRPEVFYGKHRPARQWYFFCTSGFTRDAENYARSQESKRIMLINSAKLAQLWTNNIPRLSDQAWQRLPLTPIYSLTPEGKKLSRNESTSSEPTAFG